LSAKPLNIFTQHSQVNHTCACPKQIIQGDVERIKIQTQIKIIPVNAELIATTPERLIELPAWNPDPEAEPGGEFSPVTGVGSNDSSDKFTKRANQPS